MMNRGTPYALHHGSRAPAIKAKNKDINQFQDEVANLYLLPSTVKLNNRRSMQDLRLRNVLETNLE
jgi:hypothetical protein